MWSPAGAEFRVRRRSSLGARNPIAPKYRRRALSLRMMAILVGSACHRTGAGAPPSPTTRWPPEQHCWWAAYRTTMAPDSVATQFEAALESIGFARGHTRSLGDTAWAEAGPTALAAMQAGTYAARVVAIRMADSTHVRVFVGADSIAGGRLIPMCGEIMSRAALRAVAPREQEPDDSTPRWRRRP